MRSSGQFDKACRDLHAHFELPQDEKLLAQYGAGHVGRSGIPKSGTLFVTENYVAFYSTIGDTKVESTCFGHNLYLHFSRKLS